MVDETSEPTLDLKFGEISYEDYPKILDDFVANLKDDQVVGNNCTECGERYFPPRTACVNFHSPDDMENFEMPTEATLKGYTIIHFAPDSHADKAPYVVAIGEFDDDLRVLAHLVGITSKPKIGMKMKLKTQDVSDDRAVYKFTKA